MRLRPLTLALAAATATAGTLAAWPWVVPVGAAPAPSPAPAARDEPPPLATLAPSASFAAIHERPLFSPTRRPDAALPNAAPGIAARYRLVGIVVAREKGRALVAPIAGGRTLELGEGDALEGWTVRQIESDRIVFAPPAGNATLAMSPPPR